MSLHLCSCPLSRGGHVFLLLPALLSDQAEAIGEMHWRGEGSSFLFFCLLCQKVAGISHTNRRNLWHSISMYWHVYLFLSDLRMHASSFSIVLVNCLSVKILKKEIDSHTRADSKLVGFWRVKVPFLLETRNSQRLSVPRERKLFLPFFFFH